MEDNSVCALFTFSPDHQSYPNRTHGGMITALLDEVMGRALWTVEPEIYSCTTTITVTFRKAVPYGKKLKARGVLTHNSTLFYSAKGYIYGRMVPILTHGITDPNAYTNPIPDGLVLTGIVVSVSVSALLLSLTIRLYDRYHTLDLDRIITEWRKEEDA